MSNHIYMMQARRIEVVLVLVLISVGVFSVVVLPSQAELLDCSWTSTWDETFYSRVNTAEKIPVRMDLTQSGNSVAGTYGEIGQGKQLSGQLRGEVSQYVLEDVYYSQVAGTWTGSDKGTGVFWLRFVIGNVWKGVTGHDMASCDYGEGYFGDARCEVPNPSNGYSHNPDTYEYSVSAKRQTAVTTTSSTGATTTSRATIERSSDGVLSKIVRGEPLEPGEASNTPLVTLGAIGAVAVTVAVAGVAGVGPLAGLLGHGTPPVEDGFTPHQPSEASDPNSLNPRDVPASVASDYVLVNDQQGMWTIRKIDPANGLIDPSSPKVYINSDNVGERPRDPWGEAGKREGPSGEPVSDMQTVWRGPDGVTRKVSWWGPPTQYE